MDAFFFLKVMGGDAVNFVFTPCLLCDTCTRPMKKWGGDLLIYGRDIPWFTVAGKITAIHFIP